MKRLVNHLGVSDVKPKLTYVEWRKRLAVALISAFALLALAVYAYENMYLPYTWRSQVSQTLQEVRKLDQDDADRFQNYPEMIRLELLAERLIYGPKGMDLAKRIAGFKAALELADHLGSPAARYLYGSALLSGRVGMTDKHQAFRQFELGVKKNSSGVNQGEARSTLYYALILNAGQGGLERDVSLSTSMIQQVMRELTNDDLLNLRQLITDDIFIADRDALFFGESLLGTLLERGLDVQPLMIQWVCEKTVEETFVRGCIERTHRSGVSTQKKLASSDNVAASLTSIDPEKQNSTGYVKGAPQSAMDGLSTFSIDNKQGSSDAIGRLYLNGKKPAVRSIYVKAGQTFKAQSLTAGSYVFRYRFVGSETTFEANKDIKLSELRTDTGTQFSNVTVTLYKNIGGNLPMKQVSPNDF